jgi:hypothetical protein
MNRRAGWINYPRQALAPVTGIVITVVIAGLYPDGMGAGRISIIAADPDPATIDPFIMTGDPDCPGIRTRPLMINRSRWRRRGADLDVDADLRRGMAGTDGEEDKRRAAKSGGAKRGYVHTGLDFLHVLKLHFFWRRLDDKSVRLS